jgi:hypothetical protein
MVMDVKTVLGSNFTGPQGIQGAIGSGSQGVQGTTGTQGFTGIQGQIGLGSQGVQGAIGTQGVQGLIGIQGIAGPRTLNLIIDGGGAIIATGSTEAAQSKGYVYMTNACNIAGWAIMSDANSASAVIKCDIWTVAIGDFTNEVMISGTNPPQLATARQNTSASITGWTSGVIAAGNVIQFRINSNPAVVNANSVTVALNLNP